MLSRVADSIYWMSRYVERAENVARFVDVNVQLVLDAAVEEEQQWRSLVNATGDLEDFARRYRAATQENVLAFLTFDAQNPNSILSCLQMARENARAVREVISSEMWLQLNRYFLMVKSAAERPLGVEAIIEFLNEVRVSSHLVHGVTDGTMTHGKGWHFAQLGRMLERADKTSRLLDVKSVDLPASTEEGSLRADHFHWGAMLRSASALEMYCKDFSRISPRGVVEFLVLNRAFPRSILFCLLAVRSSLEATCGPTANSCRKASQRLVGHLCGELEFLSLDDIAHCGLHKFVDQFQRKLNLLDRAILDDFFALSPTSAPTQHLSILQLQKL